MGKKHCNIKNYYYEAQNNGKYKTQTLMIFFGGFSINIVIMHNSVMK